jgi:hypothetical protein
MLYVADGCLLCVHAHLTSTCMRGYGCKWTWDYPTLHLFDTN